MTFLIFICLGALLWLLQLLRKDRVSLGLPIAYLYSLLLIHVPGAFAHIVGRDFLLNSDLIELGMRFTAFGSVCFVAGVWLARRLAARVLIRQEVVHSGFWRFCLIGGWVCIYGLSPLFRFPSVSAAVEKGGAIWLLGVVLGLRAACQRVDFKRVLIWIGALMIYPVLMLLLGGFLSYGSAAIIIVFSALTVSTRSYWRVVGGIAAFTFLSLSIFVNYFQHRNDIRDQVWGGAPLEARINSVVETARDFEWLDPDNQKQLIALDKRLNQNYFVGLAARRIEQGQVSYLGGESVWEGLQALVPRAFWPEKPVFAGSPRVVSKMTGLRLSPTTSFGVGNVMEFQINFGVTGVIVGFLALGFLIGTLDLKAAVAENRNDLPRLILFFLPCIALIQPNGSLVELFSGAAAALVGAFVWNLIWTRFVTRRSTLAKWWPVASTNHIESSSYKHESAT